MENVKGQKNATFMVYKNKNISKKKKQGKQRMELCRCLHHFS